MTRRRMGWLGLLFLIGAAGSASAEDAVRARIVLQSRQDWDVELMGRFRTDRVLLKRTGQAGAVELMVEDIHRIDFPIGARTGQLMDQFDAGRFAELAPRLEAMLQPFLPYIMDASSNIDVLLRALVKSRYWEGNDAGALAACEEILSRTTRGALFTEAAAIRVLSRVRLGQLDEASEAAEILSVPSVDRPEVAAYWYAMARLQMARDELPEAQESLARMISFRSRDPEWMPPALLLSAEGYARAGHPDVAKQVLEEVRLNYPATRWAARAAEQEGALP